MVPPPFTFRMSVGLSVGNVYCEKTAHSIAMPFGMVGQVGPSNHVGSRSAANFRENGTTRHNVQVECGTVVWWM